MAVRGLYIKLYVIHERCFRPDQQFSLIFHYERNFYQIGIAELDQAGKYGHLSDRHKYRCFPSHGHYQAGSPCIGQCQPDLCFLI